MLNTRSRRRTVRGEPNLLFYLEMKDAIEKVLSGGAASFSRGSSACQYWRRPAVNAGANVSRHCKGLLVECADTSVLGRNAGSGQEDINLRWNNMVEGCVRAFLFSTNCADDMGNEDGAPTDITYNGDARGYGKWAVFNGSSSKVNIGSAADIDNMSNFTLVAVVYPKSTGGSGGARLYEKDNGSKNRVLWWICGESGDSLKFGAIVGCATTEARVESHITNSPIRKNRWTMLALTWDNNTKRAEIYINGTKASYGDYDVTGVGAQGNDSPVTAYIGNNAAGTRAWDGYTGVFWVWNRTLSGAELKWLSQIGDLRVRMHTSTNLYGGYSFQCQETSGAAKQLYQKKTLTAEEYVVSCLATKGTPWLSFAKDKNNPISLPTGSAPGCLHPDVLYFPSGEGGYKYWMIYTPYPDYLKEEVFLVRSNDGKTWTSTGISNPVIPKGSSVHLADPDFIHQGSTWFCYYYDCPTVYGEGGIALATSTDGLNWTKYSGNPILSPTETWEGTILMSPAVWHDGTKFWMWYVGKDSSGMQRVGLASSSDGYNWQKENNAQPIYSGSPWNTEGVHHINVSYHGGRFYFLTVTKQPLKLGVLVSDDKYNFAEYGNGPIIDIEHPNTFGATSPYRAAAVVVGDEIKLYYSTWDDPRICLATGPATIQAVTSSDMEVFADTAFTNEITASHYEHQGDGVYLCWGIFTPPTGGADWNVGVEVKGDKTTYVSLPTCGKAGSSMASGPYPRSLIVNGTTGSASRQADSLAVGGAQNFQPEKGTLDIEFYPLFPSGLSSSFQFYWADFYGGEGRMRLYRDDANNVELRMEADGDDDSVVGTVNWNRGDRVKIRVVWNCQKELDGTNYMLMYGRVNEGEWALIGACPSQPTAPSSNQTLYVGRSGSSAGYEANSFISFLRIYDRPLLNPTW